MLIDDVRDLLADGDTYFQGIGCEVLSEEVIDVGRWHMTYRTIVKRDDEIVGAVYNVGSTEYQYDTELDGRAFHVTPVEKVVTVYEEVK